MGQVAALGVTLVAAPSREGGTVVVRDIQPYQVLEPVFEGLRLVVNARGEEYSPAYIQGISGAAFAIGGICPCAPTCTTRLWCSDLARLLGYECEAIDLGHNRDESRERLPDVAARVRQEIDMGRPVLVWHAFTNAEWDVVCGYDMDAREFLGRGLHAGLTGAYARAPEGRMAEAWDVAPALGVLIIGEKVGEFDAPVEEVASLRWAVSHARGEGELPEASPGAWTMLEGIRCYERWADDWASEPDRVPDLGDSYCVGIYASTHRMAAAYLREVAPRYSGAALQLRRAAEESEQEADALDACLPLLWFGASRAPDPGRGRRVSELLGQAARRYTASIELIAAAIEDVERSGEAP